MLGVLGTLAALAAASGAHAAPAQPAGRAAAGSGAALYASWKAPYGQPGAVSSIEAACGDTTGVDTLYLSFDPGRDAPDFRGLTATLYFHAPDGTTLTEFWKKGGGGVDGSPLRVVYTSDPERGFETPWTTLALGGQSYDFVRTSGRLRFIYANPPKVNEGVRAGRIYGFARVLVRRPAAGSDGCGVPMCIEWFNARMSYGPDDDRDVNRGDRHLLLNSNAGDVCSSVRETVGITPWRPVKK